MPKTFIKDGTDVRDLRKIFVRDGSNVRQLTKLFIKSPSPLMYNEFVKSPHIIDPTYLQ